MPLRVYLFLFSVIGKEEGPKSLLIGFTVARLMSHGEGVPQRERFPQERSGILYRYPLPLAIATHPTQRATPWTLNFRTCGPYYYAV